MTWDFPEIKLGLELEVLDFGSTKIDFPNSKWERKFDGSLSHGGREYVSEPIIGEDIPYQVESICEAFGKSNCQVNYTCGFHVHADFSDADCASIVRLYKVCKSLYPVVDKMFSTRSENEYCRPFNSNSDIILNKTNIDSIVSNLHTRYHWANFYAYEKHKTIENRIHYGTIDTEEILTWSEIWAKLCFGVKRGKISNISNYAVTPDFQAEIIDKIELTQKSKSRLLNGCVLYQQSLQSLV